MAVRLLKPADAEAYWELRLEALKQNPEAFATSYEEAVKRENPVADLEKSLSNAANFTFGAFHNGELVGVVTLLVETSLKMKHKANIFAMYVSPKQRGSGIGTRLLHAAIKQAKSLDELEKINLTVVTTNENAKKLYSNLGFSVFGTEEKALLINNRYYDEDYMVLFLK